MAQSAIVVYRLALLGAHMTREIVVSEKKILNFAMAVQLAHKAIEDKGQSFIYHNPDHETSCLYVHTDPSVEDTWLTTGCIVGHMLVRGLLIPIELLKQIQDIDAGSISAIRPDIESMANLFITDKALSFLCSLQFKQDEQVSWGRSMSAAMQKAAADETFYDRDEAVIPHLKDAEEYGRYCL